MNQLDALELRILMLDSALHTTKESLERYTHRVLRAALDLKEAQRLVQDANSSIRTTETELQHLRAEYSQRVDIQPHIDTSA